MPKIGRFTSLSSGITKSVLPVRASRTKGFYEAFISPQIGVLIFGFFEGSNPCSPNIQTKNKNLSAVWLFSFQGSNSDPRT